MSTDRKFTKRSEARIDWTGHKSDKLNHIGKRLANAYMGNAWQSDMTFLLESDDNISIPGHSLIVAAASPVLERCVFGTGSIVNAGDCVIKIPDCPLAEFEVFLRFIYTGLAEDLTIHTAAVLLPLAHYFDLHDLENECTDCIDKQLSSVSKSNVCETFNIIHNMDNAMAKRCVSLIQIDAQHLLDDGSLMRMDYPVLKKMIDQDALNVDSEVDVFRALVLWAGEECLEQHLQPVPVNLRKVIDDQRLFRIRFGNMSGDEFVDCMKMVGQNFFSEKEICEIFSHISLGEMNQSAPAHLICAKRPRILKLLKYEKNDFALKAKRSTRSFPFTVEKNDLNANIAIIGFISEYDVVIDEFKCKIKYQKSGNHVIFESPLQFGQHGTCSFDVFIPFTETKYQLYDCAFVKKHKILSLPEEQFVPFAALVIYENK